MGWFAVACATQTRSVDADEVLRTRQHGRYALVRSEPADHSWRFYVRVSHRVTGWTNSPVTDVTGSQLTTLAHGGKAKKHRAAAGLRRQGETNSESVLMQLAV
jgi:hypothetical protein